MFTLYAHRFGATRAHAQPTRHSLERRIAAAQAFADRAPSALDQIGPARPLLAQVYDGIVDADGRPLLH